jgi:putative DNA-invertase from lambdoid prophage Rac
MSRLFAYARVSTTDQHTENQRQALIAAGYDPGRRYFEEKISGRVPALERPIFRGMVDKMEAGDRLVVLKLDRLGRNAGDILETVELLQEQGIQVILLDAGAGDLGTAAGRLWLTLLAAFAQFESERLGERTREGMARSGKKAGRPAGQSPAVAHIRRCRVRGFTQQETSTVTGLSLSTVKRNWSAAAPTEETIE